MDSNKAFVFFESVQQMVLNGLRMHWCEDALVHLTFDSCKGGFEENRTTDVILCFLG